MKPTMSSESLLQDSDQSTTETLNSFTFTDLSANPRASLLRGVNFTRGRYHNVTDQLFMEMRTGVPMSQLTSSTETVRR